MNHYYVLQTCLIFLLVITLISGRALYYDQLDEEDNMKLYSIGEEGTIRKQNFYLLIMFTIYIERQDPEPEVLRAINDNDFDDHISSFDSYEEKQFHQRSIFTATGRSHAISAQTRQALIDILQKAFDQGWRPNLKHYIPATRFGRHRR
jgi:hypothetical protein